MKKPLVQLTNKLPGIVGLMAQFPKSGRALRQLAETVLRLDPADMSGEGTLATYDKELIATYVSSLNNCEFCMKSHGAVAAIAYHYETVAEVCIGNFNNLPDKMANLLNIAEQVTKQRNDADSMELAREAAMLNGATEEDLHDTVLIASAFNMYNRYVNTLGQNLPTDDADYDVMAQSLSTHGYSPKHNG